MRMDKSLEAAILKSEPNTQELLAWKAQIVDIFKKSICVGWDDDRGCHFNRSCSECKSSKADDFEKMAEVLITKGFVPLSRVLELFDEHIARLKSNEEKYGLVPVSAVERIPKDIQKEISDMRYRRLISSFSGNYAFLSNFFRSQLFVDGILYQSAEAAFQAAKVLDRETKERFSKIDDPAEAKRLGRTVQLRPDWEQVKVSTMEQIIRIKFAKGTLLASLLLDTGDAILVEGNTWRDTFWGVCNGEGANVLGKILMQVRDELREKNNS